MSQPVETYYDVVIANQSISRGQVLFSEKPVVTFPNIHFDTKAATSFNDLLDMRIFKIEESPDLNYFYGDLLDDVNKFDPRPEIPQVCFGCYGIRENGLAWRCKSCNLPLCDEACEVAEGHQNFECRFIQTTCKEGMHYTYGSTESMYLDVATLRAILVSPVDKDRLLNLSYHPRVCNFRRSANYNVLLNQGDFKSIFPLSIAAAAGDTEIVDQVFCVIESLSMTFRKSQRRLYLGAAQLQHSCIPNCTLTLFNQEESNDEIAIITSDFINKGDRITLDVLRKPLFIGIENRRTLLQTSYIFNCSCNYCLDPTNLASYVNGIRCDLCSLYLLPHKTQEILPFTLWKCEDSSCPGQKCGEQVQEFLHSTTLEIKGIPLKYSNIVKLMTLKSVLTGKLHPNHYLILAIQGIVAKLAHQPYGHAWGGMKAIINLKSLSSKAERDYTLILQYYTQLLRFFRTSYTIERALILRNIFYVEILLVYQNFRNIKLNRPQHLIHLRLQINRLEESGKSFIKHNPAQTVNEENSLIIVDLFKAAIRVAENLVARRPNGTSRLPPSVTSQVKLQNLLRPIVQFICNIDPAHENYVI